MRISLSTLRRLLIRCQGLDGDWKLPKGKEGAAQVVDRLGHVQIDTIAVVERAHHHTLWSRCPDYEPEMLHDLQARDRRVFEWWTHAASYLPMSQYRYYLTRMKAYACSSKTRSWIKANSKVMNHVIKRIREEGPLGAANFEAQEGFKKGTWWHWKPAKHALEQLFSMGKLMVTERRNFNRIYDLTERVLPPDTDTTEPCPDESLRFQLRQILKSCGVFPTRRFPWWLRDKQKVPQIMEQLVDEGEAAFLQVEGQDDRTYCALTEKLEKAIKRGRRRKNLHFLSPFDNLVIWRGRLKTFFNFDYRLEAYIPAAKRKYGYFCLPILWGNEFVGRLDPKADRKERTLVVRSLVFEPKFKDYDGILPVLAKKLRAFAAFNQCEQIRVEQATPKKIKTALMKELA